MGIPGLLKFLEGIPNVWSSKRLYKTKLVIDGNNLVYHLHRLSSVDAHYGGQYLEYYHFVKRFFSTLKKNQIESLVVYDGVEEDDLKLLTKRQRLSDTVRRAQCGDYINPLFLVSVFQQAVVDVDVETLICDHEADMVVAQLAKKRNCPVLTTDNDFYLFDIPGGVIPTHSLDWQQRKGKGPISCQCYHRDAFLSHIHLPADFLPLFAVLAGNDFSKALRLKRLHQYMSSNTCSTFRSFPSPGPIQCIIDWLSQYRGVQQASNDLMAHVVEDHQAFDSVLEKTMSSSSSHDVASSILTRIDGYVLPKWTVQSFREGRFSKAAVQVACHGRSVMGVQIEDMKRPSADTCSLSIRQAVYSILFKGVCSPVEIIEISRADGTTEVQDRRVDIPTLPQLPCLSEIQSVSETDRQDMLLSTLAFDPKLFQMLDLNWRLPVATAFFWSHVEGYHVPNKAVYALLLCFTNCSFDFDELKKGGQHLDKPWSPRKIKHAERDMQLVHSFTEFQSVLYETMVLNSVLDFPFPSVIVAGLFDGHLAHHAASEYSTYRQFMQASRQPEMFEAICQLVCRPEDDCKTNLSTLETRKKEQAGAPKTVGPVSGSQFGLPISVVKSDVIMKPVEVVREGGEKMAACVGQATDLVDRICDSDDGVGGCREKREN